MQHTPTGQIRGKELMLDLLFDLLGCAIFSVGVQSLSAPYQLPPGGATGAAVLINHLTGLPISAITFCINLPLLVLAALFLGKAFTMKTMKTVVILTVTLELAERFVPIYHDGDIMLAALFGGLLQGIGLSIIFLRGSTTGGSDIICRLVQKKFPHFSIGRLMLALDGIILVATALVYRNIGNALYALILAFVSSRVIDAIIYGRDRGRMLMIISEQHARIAVAVHEELGRGSTLLDGKGTYTEKDRPVLICAVNTSEFQVLKRIVHQIDPNAFVMTFITNEVLGEGFKDWKKD